MQINPFAQAKLVTVLQREILDIVVDLRKNLSTYGQHFSIVLSVDNKKQLIVSHGFGHGLSVLRKTISVMCKVNQLCHKDSERGVFYNEFSLKYLLTSKSYKNIVSENDYFYCKIECVFNLSLNNEHSIKLNRKLCCL